jgi:hypothetical protein
MRCCAVVLFAGLTLSVAAAAAAQNGPQLWLAGRAILDMDSSIFSDTTAVGPAWGVAVGVDGRRFGVQVALDWPATHAQDYSQTFPVGANGSQRTTAHYTRSSPSLNILGSFHPWSGQGIQVSLVAGMTSTTHRDEAYTVVTERLGASGEVLSRTEQAVPAHNYWWPGVAVGADVIIPLSPHMDVAAEVRALGFPGAESGVGGIFRPAAALRWRF